MNFNKIHKLRYVIILGGLNAAFFTYKYHVQDAASKLPEKMVAKIEANIEEVGVNKLLEKGTQTKSYDELVAAIQDEAELEGESRFIFDYHDLEQLIDELHLPMISKAETIKDIVSLFKALDLNGRVEVLDKLKAGKIKEHDLLGDSKALELENLLEANGYDAADYHRLVKELNTAGVETTRPVETHYHGGVDTTGEHTGDNSNEIELIAVA